MIAAWVGTIVLVLIGVGAFFGGRWLGKKGEAKGWMTAGVVAGVAFLVFAVCPLVWLYGTEAGERAQRTFSSDWGGGVERVVSVYDVEGDRIARYEGRFDVDSNPDRIIFDIPNGDGTSRRVLIWTATSTVIIEEVQR